MSLELRRVAREGGTEAPFVGKYVNHHEQGMYKCAICGAELFSSDTKFDSGTGWPSFTNPTNLTRVELKADTSLGMSRTEVACKTCGAHLGHVFNDSPASAGGKRYCINSVCLEFAKLLPVTASALIIKNLEKIYAGGTRALKGVSLEVPNGDFYALLGPNGAGKTTLIGIITGLVTKTGGTVLVFGTDIDRAAERARATIGLVPQEVNINPFEKPLDILANQAGYYGMPRSIAIPRAEQILKDLGLYDKRDKPSVQLSGGMKRRLMIARGIIHEPKLLILDEPTAGVDVELRRSMWDYLRGLTKRGVTILLTTHYLEEAEQLCKHVAIINKGEIVAKGTMEEVLAKHEGAARNDGYRGGRLEEVFLALTQGNGSTSSPQAS